MFGSAVEKALKYIRPVIASRRLYDGTVRADGGTLMVINKDGWFLSAAHIFEVIPLQKMDMKAMDDYHAKAAKLKADVSSAAQKELKKMRPNLKWVTSSSIWPGTDGQQIADIGVIPQADIILGRLDPFDASTVAEYPVFADPKVEMKIGTSLCRLGYAFTELDAKFDDKTGKFSLDFQNLVPFPLDGIFTRNIVFKTEKEEKMTPKFIETSSPGLRGHSGCPVFDTEGRVWGIQSRTAHLPLGFGAAERPGEAERFLDVGWAVHPEIITAFMKDRGVEFRTK
ncbi:MAG: serine protease [Deltaproteobacteria bacterium]|nr:serine protease [Deltaproteobacteria bacterium]